MLDSCKILQKQSEAFHTFLWHFSKQNFIAFSSSKVSLRPDCIFEIYQLRQSGFSGYIPIAAEAVHLNLKS